MNLEAYYGITVLSLCCWQHSMKVLFFIAWLIWSTIIAPYKCIVPCLHYTNKKICNQFGIKYYWIGHLVCSITTWKDLGLQSFKLLSYGTKCSALKLWLKLQCPVHSSKFDGCRNMGCWEFFSESIPASCSNFGTASSHFCKTCTLNTHDRQHCS